MGEQTCQALDAVDRVHRNLTRAGNPSASPLLCLEHLGHMVDTNTYITDEDDSGNPKTEVPCALNMEAKPALSHRSFPREHPFYREHPPSPLTFVTDGVADGEEQLGTCKKPVIYICGKNVTCPQITMHQKNCGGLDSSTTIWPSSIPEASASTIEESPTKPVEDVFCESSTCSYTGCKSKSSELILSAPRCNFITHPPLLHKSALHQPTRGALGRAPRRSLSDATECDSMDGTLRDCNHGSSNESSSDDYNAINGSVERPSYMVYNVHTNTEQQSAPSPQQRSSSPQPGSSVQQPKSILIQSSPQHETLPPTVPVWDSLAAEAQAVALAVSAVVPRMAALSSPAATSPIQSEQTWNQIRAEALEVAKAVLNATGQVAHNVSLGEPQTSQEQRNDFMWEQVRRDAEAVALAALSLGEHIPQRPAMASPPKFTPKPVSYAPQYNPPFTSMNYEQQPIATSLGWTPTTPADLQQNYVYWETVTTAPAPQTPCMEIEPKPLPCPPTAPCSMTLRANSPNMVSTFTPAPSPMQSFVLPTMLSPVSPMPSPVAPPVISQVDPPMFSPIIPPVLCPVVPSMPGPVEPSMPSLVAPPVPSSVPSTPIPKDRDPDFLSMFSPPVSSMSSPPVPSVASAAVPSIPNPTDPSIPSPVVPSTADTVPPSTFRLDLSPTPTSPDPATPPRASLISKLKSPLISSSEGNSSWSLGEEESTRGLECGGRAKKCCHCSLVEWDEGMGQSICSKDRAAVEETQEDTRVSLDSSWMESASEGQPDLDQALELDISHSIPPTDPPPIGTDEPRASHSKILGNSHSSDSGGEGRRKCTPSPSKPKHEPESSAEPKKCPGVVESVQKTEADLQENVNSRQEAKWLSATHIGTPDTDHQQESPSENTTSLVPDPPSPNTETSSPLTRKGRSCRYNRRVRMTCSRPEFSTDAVTSSIQQEHYLHSLHLESEEEQNGPSGGIASHEWAPGGSRGGSAGNRTYAVGFLFSPKPGKTVRFQDTTENNTRELAEDTSRSVEQRATQTEDQDESSVPGKSSSTTEAVRESVSAVVNSSESESSPDSNSSSSATSSSSSNSSSAPSPSSPTRSPAPSVSTTSSLSERRSRPSFYAPNTPLSSTKVRSETVATRGRVSSSAIEACLTPLIASASVPRVLFEPKPGTSFGMHMAHVVFSPTSSSGKREASGSGNVSSRSFDNGAVPTPGNVPPSYSPTTLNTATDTVEPVTSETFNIRSNEKKEVPSNGGSPKKSNFCNICSGIMLNLKAHLALISSAAEFAQMLVEDIGGGQAVKSASNKLIGAQNESSEPRRRVARVGSLKAKRRLGQRRPPKDSTNIPLPTNGSNPRLSERATTDNTLRLEHDVFWAMQTVANKLASTQKNEETPIPPAEDKPPEDITATEEDNPALSTRGMASASSSGSALCERRWVELRRLERAARRRRLREERDAAAASLARTLRASVLSYNPPPPPPPPQAPIVAVVEVVEEEKKKKKEASDAPGEDAANRVSVAVGEDSPASQSREAEEPAPAVDADSPGLTGGPSQPATSSSSACSHTSASATSLDTTTRVSHLESMESFRQRVAAVRVGDFTLPWATGPTSSLGLPSVYIPRSVGLGGTRLSSPSTESLLDEPAIIQSIASDEDVGKESDALHTSASTGSGDIIPRAPNTSIAEEIPSEKPSSSSPPPPPPVPPSLQSFRKSRSLYLHNSSSSESVSSLCRNNTSSPTTEREDTSQERSPSPLRRKKLFRVGNTRAAKKMNRGAGSLGQSSNANYGHLSTIQEPFPVPQSQTKSSGHISSRSFPSDSGSLHSYKTTLADIPKHQYTHERPEKSPLPRKYSEENNIKSASLPQSSNKASVPSSSTSVPSITKQSGSSERRAPIPSQRRMSDTSCGVLRRVALRSSSRPMFSSKRSEVVVEVSGTRSASLSRVSSPYRGNHTVRPMASQQRVPRSSSESVAETSLRLGRSSSGKFVSPSSASSVKEEMRSSVSQDPRHDPLRLLSTSVHQGKVSREAIVRRSLSSSSREPSSPDRSLLKCRSPIRKTQASQKSQLPLSVSTKLEAGTSKVRLVLKSKENTNRSSSAKLSKVTLNTRSNNNSISVNVSQGSSRESKTSTSQTLTKLVSFPKLIPRKSNIGEKDVKQDTREAGHSRIITSAGNVAYKLRELRIKSLIKEREEAEKQVSRKLSSSSRLSPLAVQYLNKNSKQANATKYHRKNTSEPMEKSTTHVSELPIKTHEAVLPGKGRVLKPMDGKELTTSLKARKSRYETTNRECASIRNNVKEYNVPRRPVSSSEPSRSQNNDRKDDVPRRPVSSSVLRKQSSGERNRNISLTAVSPGRNLPNSTKSCSDKFGMSTKHEGMMLQRHVSHKKEMTHVNKLKLNFPDVQVMISHSSSYTIRNDIVSKQQRPLSKSKDRLPSMICSRKENESNNTKPIQKILSETQHSLAPSRNFSVSNESSETELKCIDDVEDDQHIASKSYTIQKGISSHFTNDPSCKDHTPRTLLPIETGNLDTLVEGSEANPVATLNTQISGYSEFTNDNSQKNKTSQECSVEPSTPPAPNSQSPGSRHIFPFLYDSFHTGQPMGDDSNSSHIEDSRLLPHQVIMESPSLEITPGQSPIGVEHKPLYRTASSPTPDDNPSTECLLHSITYSTSSMPSMPRVRSPLSRSPMPPLHEDTTGSSAALESYSGVKVEEKTRPTLPKSSHAGRCPVRIERDRHWPLSRARSMPNRERRRKNPTPAYKSPPRASPGSTSQVLFRKESSLLMLAPPPTPYLPSTPPTNFVTEHLSDCPLRHRISHLPPDVRSSPFCHQPCSSRTSSPDRSEYYDAVETSPRTRQTSSSARFSTKLQKPS